MKDATGELSMTAVAVVAIAGIAGLFGTLVWPQIRANIIRNTYCSQSNCDASTCDGSWCECTYLDNEGNEQTVRCPDESGNDDVIN